MTSWANLIVTFSSNGPLWALPGLRIHFVPRRMRFPAFELPTADGGTLSNEDLLGRPWIAYLARHPG